MKRPFTLVVIIIVLCFTAFGCKRTNTASPPNLGDAFVYFYDYQGMRNIDFNRARKTSFRDYVNEIKEQARKNHDKCALAIVMRFPRPRGFEDAPSSLAYFLDVVMRRQPKRGSAIFKSLVAYGRQNPRFNVDFSYQNDVYKCFMKFAYPYILRRHPALSPMSVFLFTEPLLEVMGNSKLTT